MFGLGEANACACQCEGDGAGTVGEFTFWLVFSPRGG